VVFTSVSKGTFPGQSEGAGSINIIRNITIKLGDFDGVARAWRAHFLTQQHPGERATTHSLLYNRDSYRMSLLNKHITDAVDGCICNDFIWQIWIWELENRSSDVRA